MSKYKNKKGPNIFTYTDFKLFLKDLVSYHKTHSKDFTMRNFANKAGFGSPSFLKMILDGQRKLSEKNKLKFCDLFNLKDKEKDYFLILVDFNQALEPDNKIKLSEKLDSLRPRVTFSKIEKNQNKYLSNDYFAAIREMVLLTNFKEDAKWIAAKCLPRISPAEARDAINTLLELGLLQRNESGKLIQADPIVDTGTKTNAVEAFKFHEAQLNKARKYLSALKQNKRHFTALTLPIPRDIENKILDKINQFQNDILDMINQENLKYEDVFQLNMQFFPVTSKRKKTKKDNK